MICTITVEAVIIVRITTSKSKNSESFYITQSYTNRLLNRALKGTYTTEQLLHILKDIKFADVEKQGFMPVYERQKITDDLHETCGFRTDYQFITKRKMKGIQKKSKRR